VIKVNCKLKYINIQQEPYSCGPVAIINTMKYLGQPVIYRKEMKKFKNIKEYDPNKGILPYNFSKILNKKGIKYKRHNISTVTELENILDKGNSLILNFCWDYQSRHYAFIIGHTPLKMKSYNIQYDYYSKTELRINLKNSNRRNETTIAWEIL